MKKQTNNFKKIFFTIFCLFVFSYGIVFALDKVAENIANQSASDVGSNNSLVSFLTGWNNDPQYINAGNNSTVIGNYFSWYYYDSVYGFFRLDWDLSGDVKNNVHVSWSTSKCDSWYGYKIWGYAYSENFWFIDFDYNSSTYVYYCIDDKKMHGYAYSDLIWFQNFEWIWFEIITRPIDTLAETTTNTWFVNDTTNVVDTDNNPNQPWIIDYQPTKIGTDTFEFKDTSESIFYIIK